MISETVIWWGLSALLLFWSVGAYNRLFRLRSHAERSFGAMAGPMQRYAHTLQSCPGNPNNFVDPLRNAPVLAWEKLLEAQAQFSTALAVAHTWPLDRTTIHALAAADTVLQMAWMQACDNGLVATDIPLFETLPAPWSDARQQIRPAAQAFAQAVKSYNSAITQFPALLLAWLFGFHTATSLPTDR